jgi:hypothetical protein
MIIVWKRLSLQLFQIARNWIYWDYIIANARSFSQKTFTLTISKRKSIYSSEDKPKISSENLGRKEYSNKSFLLKVSMKLIVKSISTIFF